MLDHLLTENNAHSGNSQNESNLWGNISVIASNEVALAKYTELAKMFETDITSQTTLRDDS